MVKVGVYLLEHTHTHAHELTVLQNKQNLHIKYIFYIHLRFYMVITNCIEMKWFKKSLVFVVTVIFSVRSCSLCIVVDDAVDVWVFVVVIFLKFGPINDKLHHQFTKYLQAKRLNN